MNHFNDKGKKIGKVEYNKTQLKVIPAVERGMIHRDYIAHMMRFSHVVDYLGKSNNYIVLDIGCGNMELGTVLYTNRCKPKNYIGIDIRDIGLPDFSFPVEFIKQDITLPLPKVEPNLIVCFEVIEHMSKESGIKLLKSIHDAANIGTKILLSTPCNDDIHFPKNHIYEWHYQELKDELEKSFTIVDHYGTFMNTKLLWKMNIDQELLSKQRKYMSVDYLSVIYASAYPEKSRNVMWDLRTI